ncbi:MAG: ATP-binding cassette domain-containing protein [Christensenellaceae bacterium]|nr:ATP-binding cassette domain-containing protein [Christensenellaceae bacterium]
MPLIVNNLTLKYLYGVTAIQDISFTLNSNEKLAVLALESGGKTTLFKSLAGLLKPATGNISINNINIYDSKLKDLDIVAISSDLWIKKHQTVKRSLEAPLRIRGIKKKDRLEQIVLASSKFGIYPNLTDLVSQLDKEDLIRTVFARSSLRTSNLFLIDNVFAILNTPRRTQLFREMTPYIKSITAPFVFMTDSPDEAFSICEKVLILNFGVKQQYASPLEILTRPETLFVDKFIFPYKTTTEVEINNLKLYYRCSFVESKSSTNKFKVKDVFYRNNSPHALLTNNIEIPIMEFPIHDEYSIEENLASSNYFTVNDEKRYDLTL